MRRRLIPSLAIVLLAVAIIGYRWIAGAPEAASGPILVPVPAVAPQGELKATTDTEAIFKRAFWRRPGKGDLIRNAVLSEWLDEGAEVSRWQWFIEIEPSPGLNQWLRQDNPFALIRSEARQLPAGAAAAPAWFPRSAQGLEIHQSGDGGMSLLFCEDRNVLYATGSGYGFAKGAAAPARTVVSVESGGRLPRTPPPIDTPSSNPELKP